MGISSEVLIISCAAIYAVIVFIALVWYYLSNPRGNSKRNEDYRGGTGWGHNQYRGDTSPKEGGVRRRITGIVSQACFLYLFNRIQMGKRVLFPDPVQRESFNFIMDFRSPVLKSQI